MFKQNDQVAIAQSQNSVKISDEEFADNSFMTEEETKKILTPFAFKIDKSLFGIPLAVPWRRGLALFIDFIFIAILSGSPGELLAIVVAITAYRMGNVKSNNKTGQLKKLKRISLRLFGAFIIFVILIDTLPTLFEDSPADNPVISKSGDNSLNWADGLALGALSSGTFQKINASSCTDISCWKSELLPFIKQLPALTQNDETVKSLVDTMVVAVDENNKLNKESRKSLEEYFLNEYLQLKTELNPEGFTVKSESTQTIEISEDPVQSDEIKIQVDKNTFGYKGVEWMKGIIEDLGLGFGWAAFYFTVLTSIWNGQTPGKRLLKIRVVQLDGTKLSVWDSFGRYGGYGAGLATGLLGFLQIYWDPNRQAIHDKISSTIVIDVTKFEQMKSRDINKI
ncbi:MAG: hypothetical protein ACI9YH_001634 [Colwellia sp.]|jgi:uncharacterized RDD family membrane protein YckC